MEYFDADWDDEDEGLTEEDLAAMGLELVDDDDEEWDDDPDHVSVPLEEAAAWADAYQEAAEEQELYDELDDALEAVEYELGRELSGVEAEILAEHAYNTGVSPQDSWDSILPADLSDDDYRVAVMEGYMEDAQGELDEAEAEGYQTPAEAAGE